MAMQPLIDQTPTDATGACQICGGTNLTASLLQWGCPILEAKICETHCADLQLDAGSTAREHAARLRGAVDLLAFCRVCPHGGWSRAGTDIS